MNEDSKRIQNTYLFLNLAIWLPIALILGINTLFLLDAGLSNVEAFAANAFYTVGLLLFEIPTGMVADTWGRRTSFMLGLVSQILGAFLYFLMWQTEAPFWGWAIVSAFLGMGYTFFSGALEAWLVDELNHAKYKGPLDPIFAKAQVVGGIAMLTGTIAGGFIAQATNLGVPYLVRCLIQIACLVIAFVVMKENGFSPEKSASISKQVRNLTNASLKYGLKNPPVRWVMLSGLFLGGVSIYAFYAAQPYLLELFGDKQAIGVAGIAAAILTGTQIAGGLIVPAVRRVFKLRTDVLITCSIMTAVALVLLGFVMNFYVAISMLVLWALAFSATQPVRKAFINSLIPSKQRATVLSFDSMIDSSGGVVFQPVLGRVADISGYATSYVVSGVISLLSLPLLVAARAEHAKGDAIDKQPLA
jgi:MFS family permease